MATIMKDAQDRRKQKKVKGIRDTAAVKKDSDSECFSSVIAGIIPKQHIISIVLFLAALFFIITFSSPALFMNDEWITVNQLHQLDIGHQIVTNEGKYGYFENRTMGPYFAARNNLLMYSLALPLLSLPAVKLFGIMGDFFRFGIILGWTLIPVVIALLISQYYPQYSRIKGISIVLIGTIIGILGFFLNLAFYKHFLYSAPDAPFESAAVVLTNHLLFALTVVVIFRIFLTIFPDLWTSLFGTFSCICCSSFIFWAGNAKDHMLVALLFSLVLFFFIRFILNRGFMDATLAFSFTGLLAWVRPEVGFSVFLFSGIFFCGTVIWDGWREKKHPASIGHSLLPIIFTAIGAIPFFINNTIVTGNPLQPGHLVTEVATPEGLAQQIVTGDPVLGTLQVAPAQSTGDFFTVISGYFQVQWITLPQDLIGILISPESGNMSLLPVCPFILIAGLFLVNCIFRKGICENNHERRVVWFLAAMVVCILFAYIGRLSILNADGGITPDMRYLSPLYIPAGILGIWCIRDFSGNAFTPKRLLLRIFTAAAVLGPAIVVFLIIFQPFGGNYFGYTVFFKLLIITETLLLSGGLLLLLRKRLNWNIVEPLIIVLVVTVFSWQMMMLVLYSVGKFNGYSFWLPAVNIVYNSIIQYNW